MKKPLMVALIVLAIGLIFFAFFNKPASLKELPSADNLKETSKEKNFIAKQSERTIAENEGDWIINALYPVSNKKEISLSIEETIQKIISDFKESDFGPIFEEGFQSTLGINYSVTESQETVSYIFKIYSYGGGAHGMTSMVTRVFDTETGNQLGLRDIFIDGYFTNIREELRATLTEKLGESSTKDAIEGGTALEDYIENFYLTDTAIGFVFSSYGVGPYAIGVVDVQVPFENVGEIIEIEKVR